MQDEYELRIDIPLPPQCTPRQWEQGWRSALAAQRLTAIAMPPAQAVCARFRVCGAAGDSTLSRYLPARLAALPGTPRVEAEPADTHTDWQGVRVWLAFRAADLPVLLARPMHSRKSHTPKSYASRGRRS